MRITGLFKRLRSNERGNVLVICAAAMPMLVGSAALAIDTVQLSLWKRQLQRAADSGAIAGAYALAQNRSASAAVTRDLSLNNDVPFSQAAQIENAPVAGPYAGDPKAVRVILTSQRSLPFMSFFMSTPPTVSVASTAAVVSRGKFCMVSLDGTISAGIEFTGNTNVKLGCGIAANSRGAPAITAKGNSFISATPIAAVGSLPVGNDKFMGSTMLPYSTPQEDPFADRPDPTAAANAMSCQPANTTPVTPGCYNGLSLNGTMTLPPGIYYIKNGDFNLGSHANITGTGVSIVLTGDPANIGTINMNGQAKFNITSPEDGPYRGIAIYQDRDVLTTQTVHFNGGNGVTVQGALYFPNANFIFNGGADMPADCLQVVARQIDFSGNSEIKNNCPAGSASSAFEGTVVRLVG